MMVPSTVSETSVASSSPSSPTTTAATSAANEALDELNSAAQDGDVAPASTTVSVNGVKNGKVTMTNGTNSDHNNNDVDDIHLNGMPVPVDKVSALEAELARTREEKEMFESRYESLLSRIQTMKSTLGNKLKQDAEELDRREHVISSLTAQTQDLQSTISTLQAELVSSHEESERTSRELELIRSRALEFDASSRESLMRERELREVREESERLRLDKEDLEHSLQKERILVDEYRDTINTLRKDLESERASGSRVGEELVKEAERVRNLEGVLEDFQTAKDIEFRQAVSETQSQLETVTLQLAEYKQRAHNAEAELETLSSSTSTLPKLQSDLHEKVALIGKLRHQNVILNEHLTEALRRLARNEGDGVVDRRLVTNILLSFLSTPRGDTKRFEILALLGTILQWSDDEREKAGLQRTGPALPSASSPAKSKSRRGSVMSDVGSAATTPTGVGEESFSKMWVEFLLKEAAQGQGSSSSGATAMTIGINGSPRSPTGSELLSPSFGTKHRIASLGSLNSTSLHDHKGLATPIDGRPARSDAGKDKEKERRLL